MASMRAGIEKAFRMIGLMFRDVDARLKALEIRTASLYPNSELTTNTMKLVPDYRVKRADGTKAYEAICSNTYGIANGSQNGTYGEVVNVVTVKIYGLDGVTVVKTYTYSPTSNYQGPITALTAT